jgi:hypothetical protein
MFCEESTTSVEATVNAHEGASSTTLEGDQRSSYIVVVINAVLVPSVVMNVLFDC